MAFEPKLQDTIITDAGRHIFLSVGDGQGTLVYTRVILSSQKMKDKDGNQLPDEDIRAITSLSDDLKEGVLELTPVTNNTITITGQFSNKDLADDLHFSTIGWYARIDKTDDKGVKTKGEEALIAITPTAKDEETLAAGSPDHRSSQIISAELDMALSNKAKVDMTVNELGYVTRAELDVWETKVKGDIDKKLADADIVHKSDLTTWEQKMQQFITNFLGTMSITVGNNGPYKQDANHNIALPTYTSQEIDAKLRAIEKVINSGGKTTPSVPIDYDNLTKQEFDNTIGDYTGRINYLQTNAVIGKRFTKIKAAQEYEVDHPNCVGVIKDTDVPVKESSAPASNASTDETGYYTTQELSTKLNQTESRLKYLEKVVVIGKQFANLSDAKSWVAQHQDYLAYVQEATDAKQKTPAMQNVSVASLLEASDVEKPASGSQTAQATTAKPTQPTQATDSTQATQATDPIDSEGNIKYYTKAEFDAKFKPIDDALTYLEQNALISRHFDTQEEVKAFESERANYLGFAD